MVRLIVGGSVLLGLITLPAPSGLADEPSYQCVARTTEGGSWTDNAFEGYALGYAVHSGDGWMSLTCTITVNGNTAATVTGQSAGGQVVSHGPVRFTATTNDVVYVTANLTSAHGTQTKYTQYFPHQDQPVHLPTGQTYECGLDAVKPGSAVGDPSEGIARGYVTRVRGGDVTIRCFVTVDGYEQQFSSTPTGGGMGAAITSGLVMFHAEPWSSVQIVTEITTPEGTFSTARPYTSTVYEVGVDALAFDAGCSLRGTRDGLYYYEGDIYGYVMDSNAYVSVRCYITINGWYSETTPTSTGRDIATTQASVRFDAYPGADVELCAEAWSSDGSSDVQCKDTTTTQAPPQELVSLIEDEVEQTMWGVKPLGDPLLCPFLPMLAGNWGPVTINYWDGDVLVEGRRVYDCPSYAWDEDDPGVVEVITA